MREGKEMKFIGRLVFLAISIYFFEYLGNEAEKLWGNGFQFLAGIFLAWFVEYADKIKADLQATKNPGD